MKIKYNLIMKIIQFLISQFHFFIAIDIWTCTGKPIDSFSVPIRSPTLKIIDILSSNMVCNQVNATKWIQPSECNKVIAAKWMQKSEYIQVNANRWMWPSECNQVNATIICNQVKVTKWMQQIECNTVQLILCSHVNAIMWMLSNECGTFYNHTYVYWSRWSGSCAEHKQWPISLVLHLLYSFIFSQTYFYC